jgi:catechol 2,3-dioxygenase-like lactoylglutathione lyase family enzyme
MNSVTSPLLNLLVLRSRDAHATAAFYRALGLHFEQEQHGNGPVHLSSASGGVLLEIYPLRPSNQSGADGADADRAITLGFAVPSLAASLDALEQAGFSPQKPPQPSSWGAFANVSDPDGRIVRLSESA